MFTLPFAGHAAQKFASSVAMAQGNEFKMQTATNDIPSEWITIKFTFLLDENLPSLPADGLFTALML